MVDELLEWLLVTVEQRIKQCLDELAEKSNPELIASILTVATDVLVDNASLVRALVADLQFYDTVIPEFEPRLHTVIETLISRILGPGDEHQRRRTTSTALDTMFVIVLRTALESDSVCRGEYIAATSRMITHWIEPQPLPEPADGGCVTRER
ncbi:hypothetical protein [Nocardia sp. CA-135398]|uniref:hypothetical protein n=1 Tax=Nocardia sp. CA-135398 TaxID=3239977 RepID=UPI003D952085